MHGKVKWFSAERGYGFITDATNQDYYFAVRDVVGGELPTGGELVEFESAAGRKGPCARAVTIVASAVEKPRAGVQDDRVTCASCGKRMVPRLIMNRGALDRSVCPFCGTDYRVFNQLPAWVKWLLIVLALMFGWRLLLVGLAALFSK